jgi:hypothetical protein
MGFYVKRWKWDLFAVYEDGKANPIQTGTIDEAKNRLIHEVEMAQIRADRPTLFPSSDEFASNYSDEEWIEDEPSLDSDFLYERQYDK